jgi:hypothetical protein
VQAFKYILCDLTGRHCFRTFLFVDVPLLLLVILIRQKPSTAKRQHLTKAERIFGRFRRLCWVEKLFKALVHNNQYSDGIYWVLTHRDFLFPLYIYIYNALWSQHEASTAATLPLNSLIFFFSKLPGEFLINGNKQLMPIAPFDLLLVDVYYTMTWSNWAID